MASVLDPKDLLTPMQLAKRLQVKVSWIYEKTRGQGRDAHPLPVLRCGKYLRFSWPEVVEWLRVNRNK